MICRCHRRLLYRQFNFYCWKNTDLSKINWTNTDLSKINWKNQEDDCFVFNIYRKHA